MLIAEVKFDIAYAELENSYASIFAALGLDPYDADGFMMPLNTLLVKWSRKIFNLLPAAWFKPSASVLSA